MPEYHFNSVSDGVLYTYTDFYVANVAYMAIFSSDNDALSFFSNIETNPELAKIIQNRCVYSVKFAVKEYIENSDNDLYAPPLNHMFGKTEIRELKTHLENLIYEHYQIYKPDCYVFIAERKSLAKMYNKMCCSPSNFMSNFKPVVNLGNNKDCFVIKTPTYKE